MKSILKLSLAAILLGLSATSLLRADDQSAPPPPPPPPAPGETPPHPHMMNVQQRLQMMSDQLNLTDDQKAKLLPILQADADQRLAVHNDDSLSGDERHEKMREIGKATSKQMREVLTPDQWEKFKELRAAHASPPPPNSLPMGGSAPSADGPPPPSN